MTTGDVIVSNQYDLPHNFGWQAMLGNAIYSFVVGGDPPVVKQKLPRDLPMETALVLIIFVHLTSHMSIIGYIGTQAQGEHIQFVVIFDPGPLFPGLHRGLRCEHLLAAQLYIPSVNLSTAVVQMLNPDMASKLTASSPLGGVGCPSSASNYLYCYQADPVHLQVFNTAWSPVSIHSKFTGSCWPLRGVGAPVSSPRRAGSIN